MKIIKYLLCLFILVLLVQSPAFAEGVVSSQVSERIDPFLEQTWKKSKIPGLAVVIVEGENTIFSKDLGFADLNNKTKVTNKTLFELGSNSKAFTALAVLDLVNQNKISLSDPVSKYIPGFSLYYKGLTQNPTIEQLVYHKTGLTFESLSRIPEDSTDVALERTVEMINGMETEFKAGQKFQYSSLNYSILGRIVEIVTNQNFDAYMREHIFVRFGMENTFAYKSINEHTPIAKGYKLFFSSPKEYTPPPYRGNTPGAYIYSNIEDVTTWLKLQLLETPLSQSDRKIIELSHEPDRTVAPDTNGSSYAAGWVVFQNGAGEFVHSGSNPTFSSYVAWNADAKLGVAILANMNSDYTGQIGKGLLDILLDQEIDEPVGDSYTKIDDVSIAIFIVSLLLFGSFISCLVYVFIKKNTVKYIGFTINFFRSCIVVVCITIISYFAMKFIPSLLFEDMPWHFLNVWLPSTVELAQTSTICLIGFFCFIYLLKSLFQIKTPVLFFSVLGVFSGIGNALIIFIINQSIYTEDRLTIARVFYFFLGILLYVLCQRIIRKKLITLTNDIVFEKRMEIVKNILSARYNTIERTDRGDIYTSLNNDTETISGAINVTVGGVTSGITLICCLVYLGYIDIFGLIVSIVVLLITCYFYYVAAQRANKVWESTRTIQNQFFQFIEDIIHGSKELSLNRTKREEFAKQMRQSGDNYRSERTIGDLSFANVFIMGELLFSIVIGAIVFLFPILFNELESKKVFSYVFIFIYMAGPINGIMGAIPQLVKIRISLSRIDGLITRLESEDSIQPTESTVLMTNPTVELVDVVYKYTNDDGRQFHLGPLNVKFHASDITFIVGGNGSGKSTLAKLLTGLYVPEDGYILINGKKVLPCDLGEYFSAIFSEYYLFDRIYGVNIANKLEEAQNYLELMQLDEKINIMSEPLNTKALSTGQRKRLALTLSYLEDKPIYLFDEWAADQDPHFKKFFYEWLLPELKRKGKTIIAITHDENYFHVADRLIKMQTGTIVSEN